VELVIGGWSRIEVKGGTGTRRVELVQGEWNRIQVEDGPGPQSVEWDTGRG